MPTKKPKKISDRSKAPPEVASVKVLKSNDCEWVVACVMCGKPGMLDKSWGAEGRSKLEGGYISLPCGHTFIARKFDFPKKKLAA